MHVNLDTNNNYKYEFEVFAQFNNTCFITFSSLNNYVQIIKQANSYLQKNRTGKVFLVCYVSEFFKLKKADTTKLKAYVNLAAKKGYFINLIKIGLPLEDTNNLVNKKIEQVNNYKKTTFTLKNHKYFFISTKDLQLAVEKIISLNVKGKIFNVTLNTTSENKILTLLEKYTKFKKQIIKTNDTVNKIYKLNFDSSLKIGFKPTVTINSYIKNNIKKNDKTTKFNFINLKKFGVKKLITVFLTVCITWGIFLIADFAIDNFSLYKSIKEENIQKTIFYSNKLKNKYLPTKWGANYTIAYSGIYYGALCAEYFTKQTNKTITSNDQSINELVGKTVSLFNSIDKNLLLTKYEKQAYEKIEPIAKSLAYNSNYSGIYKTTNVIKGGVKLLVLIQNSNELRPTGGFVGSYALIETKDFKINSIKFDDIYNVDGTLQNKYKDILVKTPEEYKKYITTDYLYARDLNLLLNSYDRNTNYIQYFEAALNTKIDGVVYINTQTIKKLIELTGPIYLASYNETINKDNFDTLAQTYSEKNYYPGSTQKQDFLTLLGGKVVEKIKQNNNYLNLQTIYTIAQSIVNNDVELYFKNPTYNSYLNNTGLSFNIEKSSKQELFYIVENNLGENKVNKLTEKNVELKIEYDIRRSVKSTTITTNIKNNSTTYSFPYGDYRGLIQIYTPSNLIITQTKEVFKDSEVDISNKKSAIIDNNNLIVNVPFAVKPNENSTVVLAYEEQVENYDKYNKSVLVVKQPGAKPYKLKISLNIPDKININKEIIVDKTTLVSLY